MNHIILSIVAYAIASFPQNNHDYSDLIEEALICSSQQESPAVMNIINGLVSIERDFFERYHIPNELRGMLLSAACNESRFNPLAEGDWRTNSRGQRVSMARGILQFWPWAERKYNFVRADYQLSAFYWMTHMVYLRQRDLCPNNFSEKRKWIAAWTQLSRGRLTRENRFRCFQRTKHYGRLLRWQRAIERRNAERTSDCGC